LTPQCRRNLPGRVGAAGVEAYARAFSAFVFRAAGFSPRGFTLAGGHSATEKPAHNDEFHSSRRK
ncbi:MAG: hypothetical protein KJ749_01230, partial [Planctomycetes bacterium]|nr:hypothetical protein [Planctomycetota bacterium]